MQGVVKKIVATAGVFGASLLTAVVVLAASYSLYGDAQVVSPGFNSVNAAQLRSDSDPGYGGIDFDYSGLTFADLTTLSTDYNVTDDDCKAGSPRFQINVDTGSGIKNIFAYIGPAPSYTGCTANTWTNSTDLLEAPHFVDTSQLPGGTFYDPYATALSKYGTYPVVGIQLVVDSGWAFGDGEQTVLVDNVTVNSDVYTFENKESCKKGGWMSFTTSPGPFKNQGDCVSFFSTGGRNLANP